MTDSATIHNAPALPPPTFEKFGIAPLQGRLLLVVHDRQLRVLMLQRRRYESQTEPHDNVHNYQFPQGEYDPDGDELIATAARRVAGQRLGLPQADLAIEIRELGRPSGPGTKLPESVAARKGAAMLVYFPVLVSLRSNHVRDDLRFADNEHAVWVDAQQTLKMCADFRYHVYREALMQFRDYLPFQD